MKIQDAYGLNERSCTLRHGEEKMKKVFKNEMRRAFLGHTMAFVLLFECILAVLHFIIYGIGDLGTVDWMLSLEKNPYRAPYSVFMIWMGGNTYNLPGFIYTMLLPLLAVLPYGASYFDDIKSGFAKNVYLRTKRMPYLKVKYAVAFLCGGVVAIAPLCINFLLMLMIYPALLPEISSCLYSIYATVMWYQLFYTHPFLYVGGFLIILFVFGGLISGLGMAFGLLADYRYIVISMPLLIHIFLYALANLTLYGNISPVYYLLPGSGMASGKVILLEFISLFVFETAVFFGKGLKDDVY